MNDTEFFEKYGNDLKEVTDAIVKEKKISIGESIRNAPNSIMLRHYEQDLQILQKAMIIKELIDLGCIKIGEKKDGE